MTTPERLVKHLKNGGKARTDKGKFTLERGTVCYKKKYWNDRLADLLDEIGEGVWVEETKVYQNACPDCHTAYTLQAQPYEGEV